MIDAVYFGRYVSTFRRFSVRLQMNLHSGGGNKKPNSNIVSCVLERSTYRPKTWDLILELR